MLLVDSSSVSISEQSSIRFWLEVDIGMVPWIGCGLWYGGGGNKPNAAAAAWLGGKSKGKFRKIEVGPGGVVLVRNDGGGPINNYFETPSNDIITWGYLRKWWWLKSSWLKAAAAEAAAAVGTGIDFSLFLHFALLFWNHTWNWKSLHKFTKICCNERVCKFTINFPVNFPFRK